MVSLYLKVKLFISILITAALILGGMFFWQLQLKHKGRVLSDQQIVWLLVGLLVIAILSMGTFVLMLVGGIHSWHYLQI